MSQRASGGVRDASGRLRGYTVARAGVRGDAVHHKTMLRPELNAFFIAALGIAACAFASCTASRAQVRPALGVKTWTSTDGKQMPWREWGVPHGMKPRAVIIAVHGLSGASEDFHLLGERLSPQGVAVVAYELRGQGNDSDSARRGDIDRAETWLRDLAAFHALVRERHTGIPILWYGESLGSLIALHTAAKNDAHARPDALILASPIGGLRVHVGKFQHAMLRTASHVLPTFHVKLGSLAGMDESKIRVTGTSTHGAQMAKTPHHVSAFTLRLLRGVDDLLRANQDAAARIAMPLLMLASPHDVVSSPSQVEALFQQIGSGDKRLLWYPQSYHLLLHDVQHEEVLGDVARWVRRHE